MIQTSSFCIFTDRVQVESDSAEVPNALYLRLNVHESSTRISLTLSPQQAREVIEALAMALECIEPTPQLVRDCESVEF